MNRRFFVGGVGALLIVGLLYPTAPAVEQQDFSVGVYYLYHHDDDLPAEWHEEISEAMEIALGRLSRLNLLEGYRFSYRVVDAFRIEEVEFGRGSAIPEFDANRTMNRVLQELVSTGSGFREEADDFDLTILVFPLSKCVSRQYVVISERGASPIFLSYNAVLADIHFGRFTIEHEILHTFGLPDRDCEEGKNCRYPDDGRSVMARQPERFYLSRSDYVDFERKGLGEIDLVDVANRQGSQKQYDPRIEPDGACSIGEKPTREWRLVYGE